LAVSATTTPGHMPRSAWQRRGSMAQDAGLVVLSAIFFYSNVQHLVVAHSVTSVFFAAEQGVLVVVFLTRRRSTVTSKRLRDWFVATVGGWLTLVLLPSGGGYSIVVVAGVGVQMASLFLTTVGFLYLGRSFGIVAANRGVKVHGPYRLVRHPIYFAEFVTTIGFLMSNFTLLNLSVALVVGICQLARIQAEERVLSGSAEYRTYRSQVRWRLLPGLY